MTAYSRAGVKVGCVGRGYGGRMMNHAQLDTRLHSSLQCSHISIFLGLTLHETSSYSTKDTEMLTYLPLAMSVSSP